MAYTTTAAVKTYLGIDTNDDDALIASLISNAQAQIDAHCRRTFEAVTQTRYYRQSERVQGRVLFVDTDLLTVTSLVNGDALVIPLDQFWLEPRNSPPFGLIRLKSAYIWNFNTDGEIEVTGTWGYSAAAPADIAQAALRLTAYLYRQKDASTFDVVADPQAGVITVPQGIPKDVQLLLQPYRRSTLAGTS